MLTYINPDWGKSNLIKWKLFGKDKQKKQEMKMEISNPEIKDEKNMEENAEEIFKESNEPVEEVKEYSETLYTSDHPSHNKKIIQSRTRWESTSTIEKNVDDIDKRRGIYKTTTAGSDRLEKKVDHLLRNKGIIKSKKKIYK